jgi:AraC-like DNA-binding protein
MRKKLDVRQKAETARKAIEESLEKHRSIAGLARLCASNTQTIQKIFKEVFGTTIGCYEPRMRMQYAEKLLRETSWTLDRIALETGYSEAASFSRRFKMHTGKSPGRWRRTKDLDSL